METQKSLFEQSQEGRKIVIELFEDCEIRRVDIGNIPWSSAKDIGKVFKLGENTYKAIVKRIMLIDPDCSMGVVIDPMAKSSGFGNKKLTVLSPKGVSLFLNAIDETRVSDPETKEKVIRYRKWEASLVSDTLSGETEKATVSAMTAYKPIDSRVVPVGEVLEQHLKVARLLSDIRNADLGIMTEVAIAETEKHTGVSLIEYQKLLPPVSQSDVGYLTPTRLASLLELRSSQAVNKVLEMMGYQSKVGTDWVVTNEGKDHSKLFPYIRNGHSSYQIRWLESIVPVIENYMVKNSSLF